MKIKSLLAKIATLGLLSGVFLASCSDAPKYLETYATTEDASVVYHFLQNDDNVGCVGYFRVDGDTEYKTVKAGTTLIQLAKTYNGFCASSLVTTTMADGKKAVNIFYERNVVTITVKLDGKDIKHTGLFDTKIPAGPSKDGYYIDNWPAKFPANTQVYTAEYKKIPVANVAMVDIAGGTYNGISVGSFKIATTETTQECWLAVMGSNPSHFKDNPAAGEEQLKRPVSNVSFYDILVFCNKLSVAKGLTPVYSINGSINTADWGDIPSGNDSNWNAVTEDSNANGYRLPHENEWMLAALGNNASTYPSDEDTQKTYFAGCIGNDKVSNYAWLKNNSEGKTHEVGKKAPNSYGLYDMSGNLWEWVFEKKDTDGAKRTRKGGDYSVEYLDQASVFTSWDIDSNASWDSMGFRVARSK